jgi:tRNA dimethylallyltransferase
MQKQKLLAITGPTASGKTKIALELAQDLRAEIISSDSLLVYKGLDIGTAKPNKKERSIVPHHLIDIVEPWENYTMSNFYHDAINAISDIRSRKKNFIITGGTGFYLNALINRPFSSPAGSNEIKLKLEQRLQDGEPLINLYNELKEIDSESAKRIHPNDKYRVSRALEVFYSTGKTMTQFRKTHEKESKNKPLDFEVLIIVLNPDKDELKEAIRKRTEKMFKDGLIDEVKNLLTKDCRKEMKPLKSIGYKETIQIINGSISEQEAIELINKNTNALAKRQITWFKKQPFTLWVHPIREIDRIKQSVLKFMGDEQC